MPSDFQYILRSAIQPGYRQEENFKALIDYCEKAKIKEVMFHINGEELFQGHLKREDAKPWLDMIASYMPLLKEHGIQVSLNPWTTLVHEERGRKADPADGFTMMTDKNGMEMQCVCCPLDEKFGAYLADLFACYASIHPVCVWIEDDFRLHNHLPLDWGGCFCETHMKAFSKELGFPVDREAFVRGLLAGGPPNEYRRAWLEVNRRAMTALAEKLGRAVAAASPDTALGLMSSKPYAHAAEGRDWGQIFEAIGRHAPPQSRPHLHPYLEASGMQYFADYCNIALQTRALTPAGIACHPELENFPFTAYAKSDKSAGFQTELCAVTGCDGLTMNLFSMYGGGIDPDEDFDRTLAALKPYCDAVKRAGFTLESAKGVRCLFSQRSAETLHTGGSAALFGHSGHTPFGIPHTGGSGNMDELYPHESFWPGYLQMLGICAVPWTDNNLSGEVAAVSGQYFRNLDRESIVRLFENNLVLLEGEAAITLYELGLGELAGIASCGIVPLNGADNCYEQTVDGKPYNGRPQARMTCMHTGDFVNITYRSAPGAIATVRRFDGAETGIGTARWGNALILPYRMGLRSPITLLRPERRDVFQAALADTDITFVPKQTAVGVFEFANGFTVVNSSLDDASGVCLRLKRPGAWAEITRTGAAAPFERQTDGHGLLEIGDIPGLSTRTFIVQS